MSGQERGQLVDVISRFYDLAQLDAIVQKALTHPLEYYVSGGGTRSTIVHKLLGELELRPDDRDEFLALLKVSTTRPEVRGAINGYYGTPPDPDPYDALRPLDEPFVDRKNSRDKLRSLFRSPNRRALVVRGPKASGKSHSHWLIEHVARNEGMEPVFIQLRGASLDDVIGQMINDLRLPVQEFRDRQAQLSTQSKGFISAFRGWTKTVPALSRWCLLFDNHDDESVTSVTRDFVDDLLLEIAEFRMPPIFMVVLGYRATVRPGLAQGNRVIADDILQMTEPDIDKFLREFAAETGSTLNPEKAKGFAAAICKGLKQPFDHEDMTTLSARLIAQVAEFEVV